MTTPSIRSAPLLLASVSGYAASGLPDLRTAPQEELAALRLSLDSAEATVSGLLGSLEAYGEALGAANSGSAAVAEQQERTMEALRTRLAEAAGAAEAARAEMEEVAAEAARAKEERDEASVALEKAAEVLMEGEKAVGSLGPEITEALAAHQVRFALHAKDGGGTAVPVMLQCMEISCFLISKNKTADSVYGLS